MNTMFIELSSVHGKAYFNVNSISRVFYRDKNIVIIQFIDGKEFDISPKHYEDVIVPILSAISINSDKTMEAIGNALKDPSKESIKL
jgi:hypothetical protein